ncbi:short transmembrane mitochondrial protein 1 isoform X1 [Rattus norvegicus]|uniref:short transmembrane mitochondrial protein 1 isoform X1 n=1 Tax=Rattus norvegicus TaxID=10116 RepID=UPI002FD851BB
MFSLASVCTACVWCTLYMWAKHPHSLDLLWATWLECIWPRTTTCQTWLKNLKRLKRTWKPRRSPLVPDAHLALYSGPTNSVPGPAFFTATSKAVFLFGLRACELPQI